MQDTIIKFINLESLICFLYSTEMAEKEIAETTIKTIDGKYWLLLSHLPPRFQFNEGRETFRSLLLYPDTFEMTQINDADLKLYQSAANFSLKGSVYLLDGEDGRQVPVILEDKEFLVVLRDKGEDENKKLLQNVISYFFSMNHSLIKIAALQNDLRLPYCFILWIRDYKYGVPVTLQLTEESERDRWEIFLKIKNTPEHQKWFARESYNGPRPALKPELIPFEARDEPLLMLREPFQFYFSAQSFKPVLDYIQLKVNSSLKPKVHQDLPKKKDQTEIALRLEKKFEADWTLSFHLHLLDKKYDELSYQLQRIAKLRSKLSSKRKLFEEQGYLYCYATNNKDDETFKQILLERPLSEKQGLLYYKSNILGFPDQEYHLLCSRYVLEPEWSSDSQWNPTNAYLPENPLQKYYLHPEWYFNNISMFIPLQFNLAPYLDLSDPAYAKLMVKRLLQQKNYAELGLTDEDQFNDFIQNYIFIVTPNSEDPDKVEITFIKRELFKPLDDAFVYEYNNIAKEAFEYEHKTMENSLFWLNEKLKTAAAKKLNEFFKKIKQNEQRVILEEAKYQWEVGNLKNVMQQNLAEGEKIKSQIQDKMTDYKSTQDLCALFLNEFRISAQTKMDRSFTEFFDYLKNYENLVAFLQRVITHEISQKTFFETNFKERLKSLRQQTRQMGKKLRSLAKDIERVEADDRPAPEKNKK